MKNCIYVISAAFAALALSSCEKDLTGTEAYDPENPSVKNVSFNIEGAGKSDIAVFDVKCRPERFIYDAEKGEACFSGTVTESEKYCFLQPFSDSYRMENGIVEITVPQVQKAVRDGADETALYRAGTTSSYSGTMAGDFRLVKFSLDVDSDLADVTLRSNAGAVLAGRKSVRFDSDEVGFGDFSSDKRFSLVMESPENGNYAFVFPAIDVSESGLNLELVRTSDDRTATLQFTGNLPVGRTGDIDLGTIRSADLSWQKLVSLRFVESELADDVTWPFVEPATAAASAVFTTVRGGVKFEIDNFKGNIAEGLKGFSFGVDSGDAIKLPAFEGAALNSVSIVLGAGGTAGNPCIVNAAGKVVGESWTGAKNAGDRKTWEFLGEHNVVNSLKLNTAPGADGCAIRSLVLSYRVAAEKEYIVYDVTTNDATGIEPKTGSATLHASYSATIDEPARYSAGFEYRIKGASSWNTVTVDDPSQADFTCTLSGIETEHTYEFRAFVKGETDIDTSYGAVKEFEISNTVTFNLVFGDGTASKTYLEYWKELWGLLEKSGPTGPVDKNYTLNGEDYTFTLYADHAIAYRSASSKYYGYCFDYSTSSSEPRYNGWIRLPEVKGLRLTYVEMSLNQKGNFNVSSSVDGNNFGDRKYTDGKNIYSDATNKTHKINISGTSAGERVYLCCESRNVTILYLTLKYQAAK